MRKVSLKLEMLAVESFATSPAILSAGTVQAHEDEALGAATRFCTAYSCPVQNTEYASCKIYCDCTIQGSPC